MEGYTHLSAFTVDNGTWLRRYSRVPAQQDPSPHTCSTGPSGRRIPARSAPPRHEGNPHPVHYGGGQGNSLTTPNQKLHPEPRFQPLIVSFWQAAQSRWTTGRRAMGRRWPFWGHPGPGGQLEEKEWETLRVTGPPPTSPAAAKRVPARLGVTKADSLITMLSMKVLPSSSVGLIASSTACAARFFVWAWAFTNCKKNPFERWTLRPLGLSVAAGPLPQGTLAIGNLIWLKRPFLLPLTLTEIFSCTKGLLQFLDLFLLSASPFLLFWEKTLAVH